MLPAVVDSVRLLLRHIGHLEQDEQRRDLIEQVGETTLQHANAMLARSVEYREGTTGTAAELMEECKQQLRPARDKLSTVLLRAVENMRECAGRAKLEEALAGLDRKERFNVANPPKPVPTGSDINKHLYTSLPWAERVTLDTSWTSYCLANKEGQGQDITPMQVYQYWKELAGTSPLLSQVAIANWVRPISSACVERIYSYLTHMDVPDRRRISRENLVNTLYLRANWQVKHELLEELAHHDVSRYLGVTERERKRQATEAAVMAEKLTTICKANDVVPGESTLF